MDRKRRSRRSRRSRRRSASPKRAASSSRSGSKKTKKKKGVNICEIDYKILPVHRLKQACRGQNDLNGPKCYKNICSKVESVVSTEDNFLGNVVLINDPDNPNEQLIVKWNRFSEERENMLSELRLQNAAYSLGLAPRILDSYEDGEHFFIIMKNLIKMGYKTVHDLFMKDILHEYWEGEGGLDDLNVPEKVLYLIGKGLDKLHDHGIIHGDLHPKNVFYNPTLDKILFIDFGHSKKFATKKEAELHEKFNFTYWVTYYGKGSTLPKNWLRIKEFY
jgi:serine/threonine protein kinase